MMPKQDEPTMKPGGVPIVLRKSAGFGGHWATWTGKLITTSMNPGTNFRVGAFITAIALVFFAVLWAAHTSWNRIRELRERLTAVQSESFLIAERFQKSVLDLNNSLLRFEIDRQPAEWNYFLEQSVMLNKWIDGQYNYLKTEQEKALLHRLDEAYDVYLTAASKLGTNQTVRIRPADALLEFASVKAETDQLLQLGIQLANAHRDTLTSFVSESSRSLANLRALLLGSLLMLLVFGGGLAAIIYRDLIAPLRVKLVESRALLERQEKLASLGMLAAGVAHEIRNPLTAIKARLFTQQKILKPGTPEHADAQVIGQEINRLERIVKDFLLFARPSEPEWTTLPAGQPLREVEALLTRQLQEQNIRVTIEGEAGAFIRIDPQQIKQVLINLVQNAADAIGRDGSITLRARLDHRLLRDRSQPVLVLEVADTGKGISPEVEKRLFDPFFTTKDAGTGLGLPIAARIVEKHGGALQYQTQVGHGTTFGIVLPCVEPPDASHATPAD